MMVDVIVVAVIPLGHFYLRAASTELRVDGVDERNWIGCLVIITYPAQQISSFYIFFFCTPPPSLALSLRSFILAFRIYLTLSKSHIR